MSAIALQGLEGAQGRFDRAASRLSSPTSPAENHEDATDLSQATVDLLAAKNGFVSNLKVMQVADEMQSTTIDLLA